MIKIKFKQPTTNYEPRTKLGSALILVVVLTSLLAIIGAMFIMITRVDRMATSAISENKELDFAVESVVARISQELVLDTPGVAGAEYYDYPGDVDKWLADLEPNNYSFPPKWHQISDVYNKFIFRSDLDAQIILDYQNLSAVGDSNNTNDYPADADGDGVADSKWVKLDNVTSNKGKPIYAAIRIIDNSGMLNVNTAYKFDPCSVIKKDIDGSSQAQINFFALAQRSASNNINQLDNMRKGDETWDLDKYINDVVWRIVQPSGLWTPFDISDDLEIRNRFLVNQPDIDTRIEEFWNDAFRGTHDVDTPVNTGGAINLNDWFDRAQYGSDPNMKDYYSYRHIATTYNMDRIIRPDGKKMLNININDANVSAVYNTIIDVNLNISNRKAEAAQMAVNLVDFRDNDSNVSTIKVDGQKYYGFERPCVYISEMVYKAKDVTPGGPIGAPPVLEEANAIELYKPYSTDSDPCKWRIVIGPSGGGPIGAPMGGTPYDIQWKGGKQYYVMRDDPCGILPPIDPCAIVVDVNFTLTRGNVIGLQRCIDEANDIWIDVDTADVPNALIPNPRAQATNSIERDITLNKCIRRLWSPSVTNSPTLGKMNNYKNNDSIYIQAHPENKSFTNIGEIGMIFRKSAYSQGPYPIVSTDAEEDVRLNLADPCYQNLFQYLTVFDPAVYSWNDANETRIKGRININTAPWFVLAQLPWVSQRKNEPTNYKLAQAIVAYRDKLGTPVDYSSRRIATGINNIREEPGFESIGELDCVIGGSNNNYRIDYYDQHDPNNLANDLTDFPDLTPTDGAPDDFEERDVIFARISNLVTVRSDVFTAYILVRIGSDGPQNRVIAILDRSNVHSANDKVRIVALYPVPDPR
jgi:hypothetical protein